MSAKKLLNYQFHQAKQIINQPTLVFIHGLFGDMNNLGVIARAFSDHYPILRVDLRNHGQSFHADAMNYMALAEDVFSLIQALGLSKVILIGHSMGGKTAMKLTALHPEIVEKLIVLDIAPIAYQQRHHDEVFRALFAVCREKPATRQEAKKIMQRDIQEEETIQFLLKSFAPDCKDYFRFNVSALFNHYAEIMAWERVSVSIPTLFVKGGNSSYLLPEYRSMILEQFPNAVSFTINGANHWVHADKPDFVVRAIERFLNKN